MEGNIHYHNLNGMGYVGGGGESKVIGGTTTCCFHSGPGSVLLEGGCCVLDVWNFSILETLYSWRRLMRSAPHLLEGVTVFLVGVVTGPVPPEAGKCSGAAGTLGLVVELGGGLDLS